MLQSDRLSAAAAPAESTARIVLAVLALFVGSLLIRLIDLGSPPQFDEMYTVLAAHGWLIDGEPRIAEGLYDRARLYTMIVAWFFDGSARA